MSTKPPPMFTRMESVKLYASPKMLRVLAGVLGLLLIPPGAAAILHPGPSAPQHGPAPLPVPQQEWTTEARGMLPIPLMLGTLPSPGPNQKRAKNCNPKAAQVAINGGCWVKTETPPPCPEGIQWEHEKRCWLPVAEAKPVPQSGEPQMVNVAGEE